MKAAKILGGIVLGLAGLAVLFYLILVLINWNDRPASADALAFQRLIDERPPVADDANGYVYLLGFDAPANHDPREIGARRMAWIATVGTTDTAGDPLQAPLDLESGASGQVVELEAACKEDERKVCAEALSRLASGWQPSENESIALRRYADLLEYRASREQMPQNIVAPLPSYAAVMRAQRLYFLELMRQARQGDLEAVRAGLKADSEYWRAAKRDAQTLIVKMIGVAGLRHHYFFGNLILREVAAEQVESLVPPDWQVEYTEDERSMRLVMAGEVAFVERVVRENREVQSFFGWDSQSTAYDRALTFLSRPLLKEQDTVNGVARKYAALCERFDVPMNRYASARQSLKGAFQDSDAAFRLYNPVGWSIVAFVDPDKASEYMFRSAGAEGMRRAALLTAQLRTHRIGPDGVAAALKDSTLRDPYSDAPFEWDTKRQSVVFTGPENHPWHRQEYFY